MSVYCLLAHIVSEGKSAVILIFAVCKYYVFFSFLLAALEIFSLSLVS